MPAASASRDGRLPFTFATRTDGLGVLRAAIITGCCYHTGVAGTTIIRRAGNGAIAGSRAGIAGRRTKDSTIVATTAAADAGTATTAVCAASLTTATSVSRYGSSGDSYGSTRPTCATWVHATSVATATTADACTATVAISIITCVTSVSRYKSSVDSNSSTCATCITRPRALHTTAATNACTATAVISIITSVSRYNSSVDSNVATSLAGTATAAIPTYAGAGADAVTNATASCHFQRTAGEAVDGEISAIRHMHSRLGCSTL